MKGQRSGVDAGRPFGLVEWPTQPVERLGPGPGRGGIPRC